MEAVSSRLRGPIMCPIAVVTSDFDRKTSDMPVRGASHADPRQAWRCIGRRKEAIAMLRASRVPAVRTSLLTLSAALLSAIAFAMVARADVSAPRSSTLRPTHLSSGATRRTTKGKSAPLRTSCAMQPHGAKHRTSRKHCASRKAQAPPSKPDVTPGGSPPLASPVVGEEPALTGGGESPMAENAPVYGPAPTEVPTRRGETSPIEGPAASVEPAVPFRFFSPSSIWSEPVANAPLDPSSAVVMRALNELIAEEEQPGGGGPWINTTKYSIPVYTVPADQPTVPVKLNGSEHNAALSSAWSKVPLPANAQPAIGTDGELVLWQPSTNRLWEFWRLVHEANGWGAAWGGAMQNVSSGQGVNGPDAWPGGQTGWGASASSLSLVGGLISLEDLKLGDIDHAISMSIPDVRAGVYASPAERSDGKSTNPLSLPEGAHLRLNPDLDLAALHLPRLTLMLAEAAQRYGIVVTDHSAVVDFQAQDPTPTGTEPYASLNGYFEGRLPSQLLASFPWSKLELIKMELHATEP